MSKFRIEITQVEIVDSFENEHVRGADLKKIAETYGLEIQKDWQEKEYICIRVPCKKKIEEVIYKQTLDGINLIDLITTINTKRGN
jgi:hypothetical protein